MKAIVTTLIGVVFAVAVSAQTDNLNENNVSTDNIRYKQSGGENNLELAMDPFSGSANFKLPQGFGIKYRKFNSESSAFRMGLDISFANYVDITQQQDSNSGQLELKDKLNSIGITLRPGVEKHLLSSTRLSPYFGGELILMWQTSTVISERQAGLVLEESISKNGRFRDGFTFGVGAIAGVDFYIAKQLYLGFEMNYVFTYYSATDEKFTNYDGTVDINNRGSVLRISPEAFGSFRVGYLF